MLSFAEFLDELSLLGLRGRIFGPLEYARALGTYLDMEITFMLVRDSSYPEVRRALVRAGKVAALQYSVDSGKARIWLPDSISPVSLSAAVYHELSHVAAGHPLCKGSACKGKSDSVASHPKRLARREPVRDPALQDREADLRAQYAFAAGVMGSQVVEDVENGGRSAWAGTPRTS